MKITTQKYNEHLNSIPKSGKHILAHQTKDLIVVYQAYNHSIANYAVENNRFGGSHFSFNRMTWIKPNFLWMMYRCGWCEKENQERVLAIYITKKGFEEILEEAVFSSYNESLYKNRAVWKAELASKKVRLQWDPDHDPFGEKEVRKAIQLGIKGSMLRKYNEEFIQKIEDVTPFVKAQKVVVNQRNLEELIIPKESLFVPERMELHRKLDLTLR